MAVRRRRRGFERTGTFSPDQLGLPATRTRELRLAIAWREVAGEVLAARAVAVRVSRGTLEVKVDERRWEEMLRLLLPRLTARLAGRHPELRVRRCRLLVQEGDSLRRGEAMEIEGDVAVSDRAPGPARKVPESTRPESPSVEDVTERLTRLGERYAARAEDRKIRKRNARRRGEPSDPR